MSGSHSQTCDTLEDNSGGQSCMLSPSEDNIMDTVGVICFNTEGNIASRASSGEGYIIYETLFPTIVTGLQSCEISNNCWRTLMKGFAARECCVSSSLLQAGPASACMKVLCSVAQDSNQADTDKSDGILIVQADAPIRAKIAAAYSSLSFGIGYFGSGMERPKVSILRKSKQQNRSGIDHFEAQVDVST
ncbi:hypothetical protein ES319_A13G198900v1 [Gossypium barbadense]|uniref:Uncharacterized protein n=1 Tax=Gossypium barbadense TaxID=3634 RepID=A0A5J5T7H1_GOSBA|nr:hypothetical protein ES319_A13G198900v1 [Gossypium barbadense]